MASSPGNADAALTAHYDRVVEEITAGRVVPFLGAGANLCGRPNSAGGAWEPRENYLPSGLELASYLAKRFDYPDTDTRDLVRVSQFISVMNGSGPLYEELRDIFDADYQVTPLHRFLASLPAALRSMEVEGGGHQLIVTTNYDDVLERAFREANETFDLVSYMADGEYRGWFVHWPPEGEPIPIERPNEYRGLALDERTSILKIHGATDRQNPDWDSYVITEDHYIDYLSHTDVSNLIPVTLAAKLRRSHFLFLGYGLRDWNLRVILHRIWGAQKLTYKSWAVQLAPEAIEEESWRKRDVDIVDVPLDSYTENLRARFDAPQT